MKKQVLLEIDLKYDEAIKGIAEYKGSVIDLKNKEADLKAQLKTNAITREKYNQEMARTQILIKENNENARILEKALLNNIKAEQAEAGSLVALRAELSNVTADYDAMALADKNTAKGLALKDKINELTDSLKEGEEGTQRFYRNVGNYEKDINNAVNSNIPFIKQMQDMTSNSNTAGGAIKSIGVSVVGFGKTLLGLLANPVFAILGLASLVIMGVTKAINSSEEATGRWNAILAPFSRMMGFMLNILQQSAGVILSIIEGAARSFNWLMKIAEKLPVVGDSIKEINKANTEAVALAKEKLAIEKQARENEIANAKDALKVAELRKTAKDKEKNTAKERLDAVQEANKIEEQASKRNVELAERRYAALKKESEWSENTAETNKELAKLEADVFNARREYFSKTMELQEQENTVRNELKAEAKERLNQELNAVRAKIDAELSLMKDNVQKRIVLEAESYKRKVEDLKNRLATEKNLTLTAREAINKQIELALQQHNKAIALLENEQIRETIQKTQELIGLRLDAVISGSLQELDLKQEQLVAAREHELADLELTEEMKQLIRDKYAKKEANIENERINRNAAIRRLDWENQINEAAVHGENTLKLTLDYRQEELSTLQQLENESDAEFKARQLEAQQQYVDAKKAVLQKEIDDLRLSWENRINEAAIHHQNTLQLELDYRREELESIQQLEGESDAEFKVRQLEAQQNYVDAKQALADQENLIQQTKFEAASKITNSLVGLTAEIGESNKGFAIASKMLALAEIGINTGKAIAAGVAQAQSVPFPGNIAAIATTVATVIANITTAIKTVKSVKLATGGVVNGSGSGTSDSIPAMLSNGESVMTARTTSMFAPLLSPLNLMGGGVPINVVERSNQIMGEDMLARAFARGVSAMPAPVVSVEEFSAVLNRVRVLENLGSA